MTFLDLNCWNPERWIPASEHRRVLTEQHVTLSSADIRLRRRVKISFIQVLKTYIIQFYPKIFICIKIWKYVFLGDIKLYTSNDSSNLNIALIFWSLDSYKIYYFT
jgi:hypothetical protein